MISPEEVGKVLKYLGRDPNEKVPMTYWDLAGIIASVLNQANEHRLGHVHKELNICLFDAGSERDVMAEELMDLNVDAEAGDWVPSLTWSLGFRISHGEEE